MPLFNKIAIIGPGLMGASLCKMIEAREELADDVVLVAKNAEQLEILDKKELPAELDYETLEDADLIVVAAPLAAYPAIAEKIAKTKLLDEVIITDVGSVKQYAEDTFVNLPNFVGSHPVAGSHLSGVGTVVDDLYQGKKVFMTAENEQLKAFWQAIEMDVEVIEAAQHDRIYAYVSHLVQKLAFNLENLFDENIEELEQKISVAEFSKFTRLAQSSPKIWQEIFSLNEANLAQATEDFILKLEQFIELANKREPQDQQSSANAEYIQMSQIVALTLQQVVASEIEDYEKYIGTGFKDFIAVLGLEMASVSRETKIYVLDRLERFKNSL